MKAPKIATMSLDAMYSMRNALEKAISSRLKVARKGIAALPMMGTSKPKRKTKKAAGRTAGARATGRKTTARKTAGRTAKPARAAAKRKTMTRVSRKRK